MKFTRRAALTALGALPTLARPASSLTLAALPRQLPDTENFAFPGVYLDAAFVHPLGQMAQAAASQYLADRHREPQSVGPRHNARGLATDRFARLINASAADIAVVPSTLEAENLVNQSLGIGPGAGVVTDAGHYDGALALYGELSKRGTPVGVVRPRGGRIDLSDVRKALHSDTRLIAVSLVSSTTGFTFDLAEFCALAHSRGVLVYADLIQAAGAYPIDVEASGIDFAACGTYKWLMGDFGTAFLYVRPDRLDRLRRVQVGWRTLRDYRSHALPFESAGPMLGSYELTSGAAGIFEVSTPSWGALATAAASLGYIESIGVDNIMRHRQPLLDQLRARLPGRDFIPLTEPKGRGPVLAFACKDAHQRFAGRLADERIQISLYEHRIRISPSIYNVPAHVEQLIGILCERV